MKAVSARRRSGRHRVRILGSATFALAMALGLVAPRTFTSSPAAAAGETTAWNFASGGFEVDAGKVVSRSDLVYGQAPMLNTQAVPLGNGTLGAAVWADHGFTAQLNRGDTFPGLKSPGHLIIPGLAAMTQAGDYAGRLRLYDGQFVQSGGGMTATTYVRSDTDQLVVEVTGANSTVDQTVELNLWAGRSPATYASGAVAALGESWVDTIGNDPSPYRNDQSGKTFGSLAAVTADGQSVSAALVDADSVKLTVRPRTDGSFRVVVGAPSYNGATLATAATDAVAGATGTATQLAASHLAWWHALWDRVSPMKVTSSSGEGEYLENLRALSLYTTAATERADLPATHGGVANRLSAFKDFQPWFASHYWHFNMRQQVAQNLGANLADFNAPYFNLYTSTHAFRETETARWMPGMEGICVPETMRFNGTGLSLFTEPDTSEACKTPPAPASGWTSRILSSGPEVAYNMWLQSLYTNQALAPEFYDFLADVCRFYLTRLDPVDGQGKRHLTHVNAFENQWDTNDPATDLAAMKRLFPLVAALAEDKGDTALAGDLRAAIPQIPDFRQVTRGGKAVIAWSATDQSSRNYQNPDLEPIWPWSLFGDDSTLAQDTFAQRVYPMYYDWSMEPTQAARLGRPDDVQTSLINGVKSFQHFSNGLTNYGPSVATPPAFYSEFGPVVSSGLQEALVSYYEKGAPQLDASGDLVPAVKVLRVRSGWPANWDVDGGVQILGGHKVSVQVRNNVTQYVGIEAASTVTADNDEIVVANPWPGQQIRAVDGRTGAVVVAATSADTITIALASAGSVVVERTSAPVSGMTFAAVTGTQATAAKHLGTRMLGLDPSMETVNGVIDWRPTAGDTVIDFSGRHVDGSVQGGAASYVAGPTGPALTLDDTRFVSAPNPGLPTMSSFSFTTQVRVDGTGTQRRLVDAIPAGGGPTSGFLVDVNGSNQVRFIGAGRSEQTNVTLPSNQFVHLAVTLDATGMLKVYLNGSLAWSRQDVPAPVTAGNGLPLRFGADQNGGSRLTGAMGRTRVLAQPLSPADVAADARAQVTMTAEACPTVADSGLLLDWNPSKGALVVDTSGHRRDAFVAGTTAYTAGLSGPALVLGGGTHMRSGAKVNLGPLTALTVQAQVRADSSGTYRRLVDAIPVGEDPSTGFLIDLTPTNNVRFIGAGAAVTTGAVVPTGSMVDLAVTLASDGTLTVYKNGVSAWSGHVDSTTLAGCGDLPVRVGADQNGGSALTGAVGRVRIWGDALSSGQIAAQGAQPATEECRVSAGSDPLFDWKPVSGSSTIPDASSYFRPGLVSGTAGYTTDPDGDAAVVLTGSQFLQSSAVVNLGPLTGFTAAAHLRVDAGSGYRRLFDYIPAGGSGTTGFLIDLTPTNNVRFIGAGGQLVVTNAVIEAGSFTDVAVTLDANGSLSVYQDGVVEWSGSVSRSVWSTCAGLRLRFGADQSGNSKLSGAVGRVRLWPRVLTAAEVAAL
jgi:hypothetical protein